MSEPYYSDDLVTLYHGDARDIDAWLEADALVCDVPYVGKRWVHQVSEYDRTLGISYWTKNYRTGIEATDDEALSRRYEFFDPIHTLPAEGQQWWAEHAPVSS